MFCATLSLEDGQAIGQWLFCCWFSLVISGFPWLSPGYLWFSPGYPWFSLVIPLFSRGFAWRTEDLAALLEEKDLLRGGRQTHGVNLEAFVSGAARNSVRFSAVKTPKKMVLYRA